MKAKLEQELALAQEGEFPYQTNRKLKKTLFSVQTKKSIAYFNFVIIIIATESSFIEKRELTLGGRIQPEKVVPVFLSFKPICKHLFFSHTKCKHVFIAQSDKTI